MKPKPLVGKPDVRRGPKPQRDWAEIAATLRRRPGVWHEIAHYQFQTNEATRIKTGANPEFREGMWDAMREATEDGYVIYAVYLGEEEGEEE